MADCTESKIDIRGCKVHMRRGGSGEPALFLHGASGVAGWIPAFQSLAETYDLMVPDHPTYGRSDEPEWLDNMDDLAMFYLDLLDEMDLDGVHLIGNSLGGWLAMEIAVRSCTRIKSLTLIGSAGIRIKGKPITDIFMMDPDDLVRASGPQAFTACLDQATGLLDHLWSHELNAQPLASPEARAGFKARLNAHADTIADGDIKALYRREIGQRFSDLFFAARAPSPARAPQQRGAIAHHVDAGACSSAWRAVLVVSGPRSSHVTGD